MLAPVIGRPASWSQKMIWRYSSSATVACSPDMPLILTSHGLGLEAPGERLDAPLGQRRERERLIERRVEGGHAEPAREAAGGEHRARAQRVAEPAGGQVQRRRQILDL